MHVTKARTRSAKSLALILGLGLGIGLASGEAQATGGDTGGAPSGGASAWFIAPLPNESYENAPVTIDIEIGVDQGSSEFIDTVEVFVDGESIGSMSCNSGCVFSGVKLRKGEHDLELLADTGYASDIRVYVDTPVGGGGNCSVQAQTPWLWSLLALPGLFLLTSRRRD